MYLRIGSLAAACSLASAVLAQEAMYTQAATMPGPGSFIVREQLHWFRYGTNPITGDKREDLFEASTSFNIGLVRALAVTVDVPAALKRTQGRTGSTQSAVGVEDFGVLFKYRVAMDNPGGVDTTRFALLGGADITSGDNSNFASQSVNPRLGAVYTRVRGRHGFNVDTLFTLNTGGTERSNNGGEGPSDALALNVSYLYRIDPDRFTSESNGAWYITAEINTLYETNGDAEVRWSPGLMYEGRTFGLEFMSQFPLWHDVRRRPELDFGVGVGVRFLF